MMHRDLLALENGGYKTHPSFAKYLRALTTVPQDDDVSRGGSA